VAARLSAPRTGRTSIPRNIIYFIVHLHPVAQYSTSRQGNNKEQAHTTNKGTNEHDKKELKKRNSNLLEKQVLTPEDGQIRPKHVV
jgi:hypothetical protein